MRTLLNDLVTYKKIKRKIIPLLLLMLCLTSCKSGKDIKYSFFVSGHTYGAPRGASLGVYDSLKNKFDLINSSKKMKFGVLTGDIVRRSNVKSWDSIDRDLELLKVPVFFSRGNHDGELSVFEKRYGDSYKYFRKGGDLHIILDSNLNSWNISGEQLSFLKQTIKNESAAVNNIFIYVHHVIWWNKKGSEIRPNSRVGMSDNLNFWTTIAPILYETKKPVFVFSGDVGAGATNPTCSYEKQKNLTLITSGMGGGIKDNFIIVDIRFDHTVSIKLIALNGIDINGLGNIEDY